jgi:hypothetical protein
MLFAFIAFASGTGQPIVSNSSASTHPMTNQQMANDDFGSDPNGIRLCNPTRLTARLTQIACKPIALIEAAVPSIA